MSELRALLNPPTAVVEQASLEELLSPVPGRLPGPGAFRFESTDPGLANDRTPWTVERCEPIEGHSVPEPL